ncbi:hypothetical protein [Alicyclobacillus sp. SO9]|uniref:hypothetical protein n=1 Tax=Alicyclobacillus sp. SO9 TaxID=2665646 RepID=UPI0018E80DE3|nr:hypothetical protein [Alicyclobacillus sp. SO9]QQE81545.1 hypothetical protein GI364_24915 [Alicyclobacillus sp. SO9]
MNKIVMGIVVTCTLGLSLGLSGCDPLSSQVSKTTAANLPAGYKTKPMVSKDLGGQLFLGVFRPSKGGNADTLIAAIYKKGKKGPSILSSQDLPQTGFSDGTPTLKTYSFNGFKMPVVLCALGGMAPSNPYSADVFVDSNGHVFSDGSYTMGTYSGMKSISSKMAKAVQPISDPGSMQGIALFDGTSARLLRYSPKNHLAMTDSIKQQSQLIPLEESNSPYIEVSLTLNANGAPSSISDVLGTFQNQSKDPTTGLTTITVKSGTSVAINTESMLNATIYNDLQGPGGISNVVGNRAVGRFLQGQFIAETDIQSSLKTGPLKPGEYRFLVENNRDSSFIQFIVHVE